MAGSLLSHLLAFNMSSKVHSLHLPTLLFACPFPAKIQLEVPCYNAIIWQTKIGLKKRKCRGKFSSFQRIHQLQNCQLHKHTYKSKCIRHQQKTSVKQYIDKILSHIQIVSFQTLCFQAFSELSTNPRLHECPESQKQCRFH